MLIVMFLENHKCYYVRMLRSRMGFGALALLILGAAIASSLLPVFHASALTTTPGGNGGAGAVVTFIDGAHIAVTASGTEEDTDGQNIDISPVTGMYFDGKVLSDGADWPLNYQGSSGEFWYDNNDGSTCPNHNSNVVLNRGSYAPGSGTITATLNLYVPETGTNTPNQCGAIVLKNVQVNDTSLGGNMNTYRETAERGGLDAHLGFNIAEAASTTLFYEASATQIVEVGDDPTYAGGGHGKYVFSTSSNGDGNFVQDNTASGVSAKCPDYITLGNTAGQYITATLSTFDETANCGSTPTNTFTILILTTTPEAELSQLTGGTATASSADGTAAPPDDCPIQNWALRWLVCPVLDAIDEAIKPIDGYLQNLLTIPTSTFDISQEPGKAYFTAWGDFRDLAVSLIVIAALVMVVGESAGFDLLDAYSIRKILPRLLTGAVAMSLSWIICGFIIQLFNNLNNWLPDIILSPFQGLYSNGAALSPTGVLGTIENGSGIALATGATMVAATAAIVALGIPAILSLLLSLFLAMIVAFVTLTIRTMIIVLWLITAPLGIACYILPTTQKGFHFWRDSGLTAFVAGLAVVTYIAAGQLVAIVAISSKGVVPVLAPVAIIVSYLGIGTALRSANGLIGRAAGAVHGAHSGAFNKLKSYRHAQPAKRFKKAEEGGLYKGAVGRKLNGKIQSAALIPKAMSSTGFGDGKFSPKKLKRQISQLQGGAHKAESDHIMKEGATFAPYSGNDVFNWALMETVGAGAVKSGYGTGRDGVIQSLKAHGVDPDKETTPEGKQRAQAQLDMMTDRVMAAKYEYGDSEALLMAATRAQAPTGTAFKNTELGDTASREITDRSEMIKYMNAHEKGRDYHTENVVDSTGNVVTDAKGRAQRKLVIHEAADYIDDASHVEGEDYHVEEARDQYGNAIKDAGGNIKKKVVVHDATGKMYDWINTAAGHDRDAAINMFAEMRGQANQSGRIDLGAASFGVGVGQLDALADAAHTTDHDTTLTKAQRDAKMRDAAVASTTIALDSVASGNDQAILSGGKPYSAEAIGRTLHRRIKNQTKRYQSAVKAGNTQAADLEYRRLIQTTASAMGTYDNIRARSAENAQAMSNTFSGQYITDPRTNQKMTVLQYAAQYVDDPAFRQIRQDYGIQPGGQAPPPKRWEDMNDEERAIALEQQKQAQAGAKGEPPAIPGSPS
jgi:hypothetical protein